MNLLVVLQHRAKIPQSSVASLSIRSYLSERKRSDIGIICNTPTINSFCPTSIEIRVSFFAQRSIYSSSLLTLLFASTGSPLDLTSLVYALSGILFSLILSSFFSYGFA